MKSLCAVTAFAASLITIGFCHADISSIAGLSDGAKNSLVAHYDGRTGVDTLGNVVQSWTPIDGNGNALPGMALTSQGDGDPNNITYTGSGLNFADNINPDGTSQSLVGNLDTSAANLSYTILWKGYFDGSNANGWENSGTYVYNLGSELSHQRDNFGSGYRVELYDGSTTHGGDDISIYDDTTSVWATVYTPNSHNAYVNGTNLNVSGTPSYSVAEDPTLILSAFSASGFDFVGRIEQVVIFESALSDLDRGLVENFLAVPEPGSAVLMGLACSWGLIRRCRKKVAKL